ncbi:MAG: hypothetical protein AAFY11_08775 [Cyanobacteria bacterium J06641_5]
MAQREGFGNGFLLGSLVGGIVGGIVGAVLVSRSTEGDDGGEGDLFRAPTAIDASDAESLAVDARRSLEEKISQIDRAIEDVRQRLGSENGSPVE